MTTGEKTALGLGIAATSLIVFLIIRQARSKRLPQAPAASFGPPAELAGGTRTHVVKSGENLSSIAALEYRNVDRPYELWPLLWLANPQIQNAENIDPDTVLAVPPLNAFSARQIAYARSEHQQIYSS